VGGTWGGRLVWLLLAVGGNWRQPHPQRLLQYVLAGGGGLAVHG
jgi:hypothetical protein